VPGEDGLKSGECPSGLVSACGIGMVGKIGCGRARLGATRCEGKVTQVPLNKKLRTLSTAKINSSDAIRMSQ
jgi:hypothetical protein